MATEHKLGQDEVRLDDGYLLVAPDLEGTVRELSSGESGNRSPEESGTQEKQLNAALDDAGIETEKVIELEITEDLDPDPDTTSRAFDAVPEPTRKGERAIALHVPVRLANRDTAVLYTDETGASRWIFPEAIEAGAHADTRAGDQLTFLIPRKSPKPPAEVVAAESRGPLTKLGRRVVRVITWVTDPLLAPVVRNAATVWEEKSRPYGLRAFPFTANGGEPDWAKLREGRCLLFIHGTFSAVHSTFQLSAAAANALSALYGGRIFGFDHPSLHHSPAENAEMLLKMLAERLPEGTSLECDVVTHSRGGLVVRALVEQLAKGGNAKARIKLRRVILVASPNQGTPLVKPDHMVDFLDRYTNLVTNLPDNIFTYFIEGILTVVKLAYHSAAHALPGLASMTPGKSNISADDFPNAPEFYAIAANFEAGAKGIKGALQWAVDLGMDPIFDQGRNDLVVPTTGSYERKAQDIAWIGEKRRMVIDKLPIHHCSYFGNWKHSGKAEVDEQLVAWLTG